MPDRRVDGGHTSHGTRTLDRRGRLGYASTFKSNRFVSVLLQDRERESPASQRFAIQGREKDDFPETNQLGDSQMIT